jgi:O-antigen ligase
LPRLAEERLPGWIAPALVAGLIAGQLGRLPLASFGVKEVPILALDVAVVAVVTWGLLVWTKRGQVALDGVALSGLAFAVVGLTGTVLSTLRYGLGAAAFATSTAYLLRWLTYFGLYLVVRDLANDVIRRQWWRALEVGALIIAGFGLIQSAFLSNFAQRVYPSAELYTQWDPQGHRLVSTFLDPNLVGGFLLLVFLQQVGIFSTTDRSSPEGQRLWRLALIATAMLLTVSRGTALAAVVGVLAMTVAARGIPRRGTRALAIVSLFALPVLPLAIALAWSTNKFNLADPSALARFIDWAQAGMVFLDHPILGIGFNTYGFVQKSVYDFRDWTASSFGLGGGLLFIATLTGTVGLALYSLLLGLALRGLRQTFLHATSPSARGLALGLFGGIPALLVHSLFTNSLLYPMILVVLWMGAATVMYRGSDAQITASSAG